MSTELTLEEQATNADTSKHIRTVQKFIHLMVKNLLDRADAHDQSKLVPPEVELFTKYTPLLAGTTYGSAEYEGFRKAMGPALAHHYAKNSHHPEHFKERDPDLELVADTKTLEQCKDIPESVKQRLLLRLERDAEVEASQVGQMNLLDVVEMLADWAAATRRHDDGNLRKSIEINQKRFKMADQLAEIFENTVTLLESLP